MATYKLGDDEKLSFGINWADWLTPQSAQIVNSVWVVPTELTKIADRFDADSTLITLENNTGELQSAYKVTNIITLDTTDSEEAERSFYIIIVEDKTR